MDNNLDNAINYKSQQVWGVRYIDDAVAKKIDRDNDNAWDDAKSEFYYLTDAMFSVRALLSNSGAVTERIDYTPYGVAMHRYTSDINEDGSINFFDVGDFLVAHAATDPGAAGYDPDADSGGDGLDFFDVADFLENHGEHADSVADADVPDGWISNPGFGNDADNSIGYDGYAFDFAGATDGTTSGVYMVRNRVYDPGFGGWLERDPLGFVDGMNVYTYASSVPLKLKDPFGLEPGGGYNSNWNDEGEDLDSVVPVRSTRKAASKCREWADRQKKSDLSWQEGLSDCPCELDMTDPDDPKVPCNAKGKWKKPEDDKGLWEPYHPNATWQVRGKPNSDGSGQQCTYDDAGHLITAGSSAGTPDRSSPDFYWFNLIIKDVGIIIVNIASGGEAVMGETGGTTWIPGVLLPNTVQQHRVHDVWPYEACRDAGMLDTYFMYRPPNQGDDGAGGHCEFNTVDKKEN